MKEQNLIVAPQLENETTEQGFTLEVAKLSKRQFLRSAITAAGAMTIKGILADEHQTSFALPLEATQSKETQDEYTKGLIWMHEKALTDTEENVSYVVREGESLKWIRQKEGKVSSSEFDIDEISRLIATKPTSLEILNTHTLVAVQEPQRQFFKGRDLSSRDIDSLPHQPPTFIEALSAKYLNEMFKDSGVELIYKVVSPEGVWEYSLDLNSEFMDCYYKYSLKEDTFIQKVSRNEIVRAFLQENPGILLDMNFDDIRRQFLSPSSKFYAILPLALKNEAHLLMAFKKEHIDSNHDFEDVLDLEQDMALRMTFACPGEKQRILNEDITLKKRLGIYLKFTPIEQIPKSR